MRSLNYRILLLFLCLAVPPDPSLAGGDISGPIESLFESCDNPEIPGGFAAAVIHNGEVVFKKGYGSANNEHNIPFTTRTVADYASVAKQFTGFAIATLAAQGRLNLDEDVRTYIPDVPEFGDTITVRHLVHHTSGLRDWLGLVKISGRYDEDVITEEFIMKLVEHQRELNFRPGEQYQYSNTGYFLLARIVSLVTGQPFPEWMRDNVFAPLGMYDTRFVGDHRELIPGRAASYVRDDYGTYAGNTSNLESCGSSSLFSTIDDMIKWVVNFETRGLGSDAVWETMLRPGVLNNGEETSYGFGLSLGEKSGSASFGHGGSWGGYLCTVTHVPDLGLSYILIFNRDPGGAYVEDDLVDLFVPAGQVAGQQKPLRTPVNIVAPAQRGRSAAAEGPGHVHRRRLVVQRTDPAARQQRPDNRFHPGRRQQQRSEAAVCPAVTVRRRRQPLASSDRPCVSFQQHEFFCFVYSRRGQLVKIHAAGDAFAAFVPPVPSSDPACRQQDLDFVDECFHALTRDIINYERHPPGCFDSVADRGGGIKRIGEVLFQVTAAPRDAGAVDTDR
jgi:CubicO group peptidase (beta-lactamase class C family)